MLALWFVLYMKKKDFANFLYYLNVICQKRIFSATIIDANFVAWQNEILHHIKTTRNRHRQHATNLKY